MRKSRDPRQFNTNTDGVSTNKRLNLRIKSWRQFYIGGNCSQDGRSLQWHTSFPCKYFYGCEIFRADIWKLSHVHLVSTYRWPTLATVGIHTIVEYLTQAPKITKEVASMNWMFLDAPPDGTVLLVWQPLAQLGTRFATDGYIWADPEQSVSQEYQGYVRCPLFDLESLHL